ncbi:efflux transporter outer membrane subunit [Pedobacter antarcticus]|uniref:efflux transporter outer membrane subunit n=1 Tax=Pedobacter antarcticus TaxID=34086 RepID=UPI00292F66E2|nr:efflux transporter outer membrane subunit [Pedobacter antarcticus]
MTHSKYILILFFGALVSCKISKDVVTADLQLPHNYKSDTLIRDTSNIARLKWKEFFLDEPLQKIIGAALAKNNNIQLALENIEAAQLRLAQAKWKNIPTLNFNISGGSTRPSENSLTGLSLKQNGINQTHFEDYTTSLSVSWEVDIWGKIRNQKAETLAAYLQTQEAHKAVQVLLISEISKGYYNLLMLHEQLSIAKKNLELSNNTLRIIKLQFESGDATLLAINQAEAQNQAFKSLIPQLQQSINITENAISVLGGNFPQEILSMSKLADIDLPNELATGIPADLLTLRPDVKAAELEITRSNYRVGYTKAAMYPSFTITAQSGINALSASNWFNIPASLFGITAAGVTQPLLIHKELKTNYELAKIDREKSVVRFRHQIIVAVSEVSDALVKIDRLKERQLSANNRVNTLNQAIDNAQVLFQNGMANYLEIITAQSSALESQLNLSTIKKEQLDAMVDLYKSLGGGVN